MEADHSFSDGAKWPFFITHMFCALNVKMPQPEEFPFSNFHIKYWIACVLLFAIFKATEHIITYPIVPAEESETPRRGLLPPN